MSSSNSAAEQIANRENLLSEILVKLPAKSLIKFKVVCKQWQSLISGTSFYLSHTKRPLKPSAFFVNAHYSPPSEFRFVPLTHDCVRLPPMDFIDLPRVIVLQSCAGLLLCVSNYHFSLEARKYFVCNPTTRWFNMISSPSHPEPRAYWHMAVNLAFDPLKSLHYKIISVWQPMIKLDQPNVMCIGIYSSETKSWSLLDFKVTYSDVGFVEYDIGVFIKGAIHWPNYGEKTQYFDVENECLKQMPLPSRENVETGKVVLTYFGECGGRLNIVHTTWPPNPWLRCSVFEMLEDHSDWYLKYTIKNCNIPQEVFQIESKDAYKICCSIQFKEEEGDSLFLEFPNGKGMCYNFKDGTLKKIMHYSPIIDWNKFRWSCFHRVYQYIETLYCG